MRDLHQRMSSGRNFRGRHLQDRPFTLRRLRNMCRCLPNGRYRSRGLILCNSKRIKVLTCSQDFFICIYTRPAPCRRHRAGLVCPDNAGGNAGQFPLFGRFHHNLDEVSLLQYALQHCFDAVCADFPDSLLIEGIEIFSIVVVPVLEIAQPVPVADS